MYKAYCFNLDFSLQKNIDFFPLCTMDARLSRSYFVKITLQAVSDGTAFLAIIYFLLLRLVMGKICEDV